MLFLKHVFHTKLDILIFIAHVWIFFNFFLPLLDVLYTFTVNVIHFHKKISEVYHENLFFLMRKSQRTSQHRTIQNVKTHNRTTQKSKKMSNTDSLYVYVLWHGGVSHLTMTFNYKVNRSSTQEELRRYRKCGLFNNERETTRAKFWRAKTSIACPYSRTILNIFDVFVAVFFSPLNSLNLVKRLITSRYLFLCEWICLSVLFMFFTCCIVIKLHPS